MVSMLKKEMVVNNRCGIHARVGLLLSQKAKEFTSEISLRKGKVVADCRSVLELLSLGAGIGDAVLVEINGIDAEAALNAIQELFDARFYEDDVA